MSASGLTLKTDVNSRVIVTCIAPPIVGPGQFYASMSGANRTAIPFTVTPEPPILNVISGNQQTAEVNATFPNPLVVGAYSANGQPLANANVVFSNNDSGAAFLLNGTWAASQTVTTNSQGQASITMRAPSYFGPGTVSATLADANPATFEFTATRSSTDDGGGNGGDPIDPEEPNVVKYNSYRNTMIVRGPAALDWTPIPNAPTIDWPEGGEGAYSQAQVSWSIRPSSGGNDEPKATWQVIHEGDGEIVEGEADTFEDALAEAESELRQFQSPIHGGVGASGNTAHFAGSQTGGNATSGVITHYYTADGQLQEISGEPPSDLGDGTTATATAVRIELEAVSKINSLGYYAAGTKIIKKRSTLAPTGNPPTEDPPTIEKWNLYLAPGAAAGTTAVVDLATNVELNKYVSINYVTGIRVVGQTPGGNVVSIRGKSGDAHFVAPKGIGPTDNVTLEAPFAMTGDDGLPKYEWHHDGGGIQGEPVDDQTDRYQVPRTEAGYAKVSIQEVGKNEPITTMYVWVVWCEGITPRLIAKNMPPKAGPDVISGTLRYIFEAEVSPASIFNASNDIPNLMGEPVRAPAGEPPPEMAMGTHKGDGLGFKWPSYKWDMGRQWRSRSQVSNGITSDQLGMTPGTAIANQIPTNGQLVAHATTDQSGPDSFPADPIESNDDSDGGHDDNIIKLDPYASLPRGGLVDDDKVRYLVYLNAGSVGDVVVMEKHFRQFVRVQIAGKWHLISDYQPWHIKFDVTKTASGWKDAGGSSFGTMLPAW